MTHPANASAPWTQNEKDKLLTIMRNRGPRSGYADVAAQMPGRTIGAVTAMAMRLRHEGILVELPSDRAERVETVTSRSAYEAAALSSEALLRALLRFGLRNDRDLGLPLKTFQHLCREHEVRL